MAKLTYWKAEMKDESAGIYALRGKTKKDVMRQIKEMSEEEYSDSCYEEPKKMIIIYKDAFDLMEVVLYNDA